MKNQPFLLTVILSTFLFFNTTAQNTYVPDDNFEQALIDLGYDSGGLNDSVPTDSIISVSFLNISGKSISDVTGIEDFTNLEELYCYSNTISEVDFSANTKLKILQIQNNNLTQLDLSLNSALTFLDASTNQLSELNLRNGNNDILSIDVRDNPDLLCIQVDDPETVYNNSDWDKNGYAGYSEDCASFFPEMTYVPDDNFEQALIELGYDYGELNDSVPTHAIKYLKKLKIRGEIIDITGLQDFNFLESLDIQYTNLDSLDVRMNIKLRELRCQKNKLRKLLFDYHPDLKYVYCFENQLTSLNVDGLPSLENLYCNYNKIIDLDLSKNPCVKQLHAKHNELTGLNIKNGNNNILTTLEAYNNDDLLCIEVDDKLAAESYHNWSKDPFASYSEACDSFSQIYIYVPDDNFERILISKRYDSGTPNDSIPIEAIKNLTYLDISGQQIKDLTGLEYFLSLETLNLNSNPFAYWDFSNNQSLKLLKCTHCSLDSIILNNNNNLEILDCSWNNLKTLNLQKNTKLINLVCSFNFINKLDLSHNSNLNYIKCSTNCLTYINLKNDNNQAITRFESFNNLPACIEVDDTTYSVSSSYWYKDDYSSYTYQCHQNKLEMVYVPDDNFEKHLISLRYDFGEPNDSVPIKKLQQSSYLNVDGKNITDLTGIEAFTMLENLYCGENQLRNLNISNNEKLKLLNCKNNLLENLNLTNNNNIELIVCSNNFLNNLELAEPLKLSKLDCSINKLQSLNVSNCPNLKFLYCHDNDLENVNIKDTRPIVIKAYNNEPLTCIEYHDVEFAYNNSKWEIDDWTSYSTECNYSDSKIPISEYNTLVDLYNSTRGSIWYNNTNWLDTINSTIDEWHGITVEDGHVTELNLSDNNLQEAIFFEEVNLPKLKVLDISNNLLGDADFSKLDSFAYLSEIYVENNNLVFRHIRQLLDLPDASTVTYNPQAKIGVAQNIVLEEGELLEINFNSNYYSEDDQFQWYKDGVAISGAQLEGFDIAEVNETDSGVYTLNITNPNVPGLTLKSQEITVSVKASSNMVGGIPREEYQALVDLYNATDGPNWKNNTNWLDTINSGVADWQGINVEDGHVTMVLLFDNNLTGYLPSSMADLIHLTNVNFERNSIGQLPQNGSRQNRVIPDEFGNWNNLIQLSLGYNYIQFNDLESILSWPNFENIYSFSYNYQNGLNNQIDVKAEPGETVRISLQNYSPAPSDQYQWIKDNDPLPGANDSVLVLSNVQISDEANYYCILANTKFPGMQITNYGTRLEVSGVHGAGIPLSEYQALEAFFKATNGDQWNWNTNWLDTINTSVSEWAGVEVRNGHVYALVLDSNNVVGPIPSEFYNLRYLQDLELVKNQISGSLSELIANFIELRILALHENNLSGEIPSEIGALVNLQYLGLSHNQFTGEIPSSLGNLINLKWMILNNNQLSGAIPENLDQLAKLVRLTIEDNLFGQSDNTKSITLKSEDEHRIIPDFLSDFLDLDTFKISSNQIQFNDIEAIFNWKNFDDINVFEYAPQANIGTEQIIDAEEEASVILSIDNYYPGTSDKFQWYKNDFPIEGAAHQTLEFEELKPTDAGNYHCIVSNSVATELSLTSKTIQLIVNEKTIIDTIPATEIDTIPDMEYNALRNLANTFPGIDFGANWLDTTNSTVAEWQGVQVRNGHVIAIDLSNLGLEGEVFGIFSAFDSLEWVNLSGNNLYGPFPTFEGEKSENVKSLKANAYNLSYLNIANNKFMFSDLEPVADELLAIDTFIYSPQQNIGSFTDTSIYKNEAHTILIEGYNSGENDVRQWYKNNTILEASEAGYAIPSATYQDSGTYSLLVQSPIFSDLVLNSMPYKLSVKIPLSADIIETPEIQLFPNPADNEIFVETYGKVINLTLLNVWGEKIIEFHNITSQRIDISDYSKGIYFFRIETGKQIETRKIIFK